MKWSLAVQLRVGFAAGSLTALTMVAATWWIALDYRVEITEAYETQLRTTVELAGAQSAFWQLRFGVREIMVGEPEKQQQVLKQQDTWYARIEHNLAVYDKAASSAEERRELTSVRSAYERYKQARAEFFELWQAGDNDGATAWLVRTVVPFGEEVARGFDRQIALQQSFVDVDRKRSERSALLALVVVTAITLALLGMFIIGYVYAARMLRPIRALQAQTQRLVHEQLGETIKASTSNNEVLALVESFRVMSERLRAHEDSLRESHERLSFLLSATPAVIWTSKIGGAFARTFVSANVRAVLGYEPEDFLRDPEFWRSRIHPDDSERVLAALPAIERNEWYAQEYRFRHKDGSWRWIRAELQALRDASGAPHELVGHWLDITERRRAEVAIVEALRAKSDFMNSVTHELRTPLNSVIGFAELLKDEVPGPLNAKQAAFAADILASGERLLALVEGILEMSRLDAAGVTLEREPVQIEAALEERVAAHGKAAEARGVSLRLEVAPDAGSADLDAKALRRIVGALLDNAIKFNRDGGAVAVSARRANGALEIAVTDTGIGIARENLAKLFRPLEQLDAGLARKYGGVGVSLALARRLAELHGGTLEVESEPGKGSTFTLHLPMREAS